MNGSDLFNGESFGSKYLDGATFKSDSLITIGTIVNVTDEKGIFSVQDGGTTTLEIIVDGNKLTGTTAQLRNITGGTQGTNQVFALEYKESLRVNITAASGQVTVSRLS